MEVEKRRYMMLVRLTRAFWLSPSGDKDNVVQDEERKGRSKSGVWRGARQLKPTAVNVRYQRYQTERIAWNRAFVVITSI
jgi:hypothetical protein